MRQTHQTDRASSIDSLSDRVPPHSMIAEMALLGALIVESNQLDVVMPIIGKAGSDVFYKPSHADIYDAIIYQRGQAPNAQQDLVLLTDRMRSVGVLDDIGGTDYLVDLVEGTPSSVNAVYYAELVAEKYRLRRALGTCLEALQRGFADDDAVSVDDLIADVEAGLNDVRAQRVEDTEYTIYEAMAKVVTEIEANDGKPMRGLLTGFRDLDYRCHGLFDGELTIIAARPGMGKTALAMNIAVHLAFDQQIPVGMFSLEMMDRQLALRVLADRADVDASRVKHGTLTTDDRHQFQWAVDQAIDVPLYVNGKGGITAGEIAAVAKRWRRKFGIQALFVDYLQIMGDGPGDTRTERVGNNSKALKELAKELSIPVVVLSQLNRDNDKAVRRPKLSDLRDSGAIEQDADAVLMIHREDMAQAGGTDYVPDSKAEVIAAKLRQGEPGTVELHWDGSKTRFSDYTMYTGDD